MVDRSFPEMGIRDFPRLSDAESRFTSTSR